MKLVTTAAALKYLGAHPFFRSVIVVGALTGMISSLLVFQYGQARNWYAMSRDGLLPKLISGEIRVARAEEASLRRAP